MFPQRQPWRDMVDLLSGSRRALLVVGALSMAIHVLMLSPSLYMLQVYDRVMLSHNEWTLLLSTLLLVLVLVLVAWFEQLRTGLLVDLGMAFDRSLQPGVFHASLHRELAAPSAHRTQSLQDLAQVRQFITSQGIFAFFDAPWFFIYAGVLFLMHPVLGALGLSFALVQMAFLRRSRLKAVPLIDSASELQVAAQALEHSHKRQAESLQAMGMVGDLQRQWEPLYDRWNRVQTRAQDDSQRHASWSKFLRHTQQSLSLGAGAWLVLQGDISAGAMIATNILMARMLQPLDTLTSSWRSWLNTHSALRRLKALSGHAMPAREDTSSPVPDTPLQVRAEEVSAQRPGKDTRVLDRVDLQIQPGEVVAVTGPSGAGKTSLALALLGLLPGMTGRVFWNQVPVGYLDTPHWTRALGYLPQQVTLITGTVAQNIARFGPLDATAVVQAATQAGVHDMILRLPKGYDTPVGPQGVDVSSGQQQRIGLARALYGHPQWLVLDEPDAHLVDAGEQALLTALTQLKQRGCTMLLITHRRRLIALADRMLVMQAGRIRQDHPVHA